MQGLEARDQVTRDVLRDLRGGYWGENDRECVRDGVLLLLDY